MASNHTRFIVLVTLTYLVLGTAWVLLSDQLLPLSEPGVMVWLSSAKGVFFVLGSAAGYALAMRAVAGPHGRRQALFDVAARGLAPSSGGGWYHYPLALTLVGLMLVIRTHMGGDLEARPLMILFMLPILLSALVGGLAPGLLATFAAAVGTKLLVVQPLMSVQFAHQYDLVQWMMLILNGAVVSALSEFMRSALRKNEADRSLLAGIVSGTSDAVFVKDLQGRYLLVNHATAAFLGKPAEQILGCSDDQLFAAHTATEVMRQDQLVMSGGQAKTFEEHVVLPDGRTAQFLSTKGPLCDASGRVVGLFGIARDITERRLAEARIERLALFDVLTGLPNRVQLDERACQALQQAQTGHHKLAVLFLDLDRFKDINDSLGHSVGDALLVTLARRLRLTLRAEDMVARLGGDEFIFLLQGDDVELLPRAAQKILDTVAQPFLIEQHELSVSASIGVAVYPQDGRDLETLVRCADSAMYRAKQNGRNGYSFFTGDLEDEAVRRLQIVNALRHAMENRQLSMCYQPQFDARDGRMVGAEALLRWQHPTLGALSPAEFIPAAEDCGLMLPIGEWVLRQAVRQMRSWLDQGMAPFVMAVNLSATQFRHPDLPQLVSSILAQEQLPPQYLELELTEGAAMHDPPAAIAVMDQLHQRGVRMAIDDFGVAYSSLSYLKKFKIYKLKIDQSFVRDISTDPEDRAIVAAIINLARSLGLRTIAEGVEHAAQLEYLREHGCDEVQGYYYSRPLSAAQFEDYVREQEACAA
ncbi:bifunctional diguanylate cyclase/phosphodiesterase [Duganella sp. HH105]|uniref:putative bifunctional diguanylate cyclase/phosphodiesterase n=1 Tax=Duganella sp. HH105 TaxID=1781067 RepID=UPI000892C0B1|nr:EAL domain-containing protein [Duganella sp. HH105]OEZ56990.1 cyclic di-GMP phosphodiesterase Gmr [Duganella sp. HH105]